MRTWDCRCGNQLFFDNSLCLICHSEVGWCPACRAIVALTPEAAPVYRCSNPDCGAELQKCHNYAVENVCNRMVSVLPDAPPALCDCCRYNRMIPDLSVEGNRERWQDLEKAKRRLFYTLDLLGLSHGTEADGHPLPLSFSFMADEVPAGGLWRTTSRGRERVYTGHIKGHITINLKESDDAEREKLRVDFNESHRTLIGHFRHEIGHYYWDLLVKDRDEKAFVAVFGDHNQDYSLALEQYYQQGVPESWQQEVISAYAAMHPWEDFAETFAFYLDMAAVLDTAAFMSIPHGLHDGTLDGMLEAFRNVGLAVNEINREMGLLDLVPEAITPAIRRKLGYVHELIRNS